MFRLLSALLLLLAPALAQEEPAPLDLARVLELAAAAPSVQDAALQLEEAERSLHDSRRPLQASAELSSSGSLQVAGSPDLPGNGGTNRDASVGATISGNAALNVFRYGPAADATTRAGYAVQRAQLQLANARQQAQAQALSLFTTAVRDEQSLQLAESALELARMQLDAAEARFEAGAQSEAQLLQANIAVASAANDLAAARADAAATLTELGQLLGVPVAAVESALPYETFADLPQLPLMLDGEAADGRLEQRRDVQEAQLAVLEAQLELRAAAREDDPRLNLDADFSGRDGPFNVQAGVGFDTGSWNPSAAGSVSVGSGAGEGSSSSLRLSASLTVPLGSTGEGPEAAARRSLQRAQENLQRTRETARLQVEGARRRVSSALSQAQMSGDLVEQARLSLERSEAQFEGGLISIIELTQARRSFAEARLQAGRSLDNYLAALISLAGELAIDPTEVLP